MDSRAQLSHTPIETEGLSNPICEYDIAGFFSAIFKQSDSDPDLHQHLAFELGLTAQLASLFTVLFINHETPEYQLQLSHDSALSMTDGSQLLGTRLTSDLIPLLGWNKGLADNIVTFGPASPPSFSDTRHHLSLFCPGLTACRDFESEN